MIHLWEHHRAWKPRYVQEGMKINTLNLVTLAFAPPSLECLLKQSFSISHLLGMGDFLLCAGAAQIPSCGAFEPQISVGNF